MVEGLLAMSGITARAAIADNWGAAHAFAHHAARPAINAGPGHERRTFERNKLKTIGQSFAHNVDRMLHQRTRHRLARPLGVVGARAPREHGVLTRACPMSVVSCR